MKKLFIIPILFMLTACSTLQMFETPESKYFALTNAVTATGRVAQEYVSDCKTKPKTDSCYSRFADINKRSKEVKAALVQADKVFVTQDSQYYDISLTLLQNAVINLRNLVKD